MPTSSCPSGGWHGCPNGSFRTMQIRLLEGRPFSEQDRQQGLPGVGPGSARALLDAFGSIAAVMAADAERLAGASARLQPLL
jgi:hypothetical protein